MRSAVRTQSKWRHNPVRPVPLVPPPPLTRQEPRTMLAYAFRLHRRLPRHRLGEGSLAYELPFQYAMRADRLLNLPRGEMKLAFTRVVPTFPRRCSLAEREFQTLQNKPTSTLHLMLARANPNPHALVLAIQASNLSFNRFADCQNCRRRTDGFAQTECGTRCRRCLY